jgi:ketosteroid isomerase-like protein
VFTALDACIGRGFGYNPLMKKTFLCCLPVLLLTLTLARTLERPSAQNPQKAGENRQSDSRGKEEDVREQADEGIKHVLVSQVEAWNRGDLQGFMNGYWQAPELTFFSGGNVSKGWQAALGRYQKNYQAAGKEMGKLEFQELNIELIGRQAAVVTGRWRLTMSNGKTPHGLFTLVMKRLQPGWRIVHDHTSAAEE